jgi:tetratricopeptide (TPR) repeat protein
LRIEAGGSSVDSLVSREVLAAFAERIKGSLARKPLDVPVDQHRERLAMLLASFGSSHHYALLGIDPSAGTAAIADAYEDLARMVLPQHAERQGLEDLRGTLELLFERATEAYLVLSNPDRRSRYDLLEQIDTANVPRTDAEVKAERHEQAAALFARAQGCMRSADYHFAVELLKEATRLEPEPESFALLAEAQSKNPNWLKHSIESWAKAIELDFSQTPWMLRHAQVLEEAGRLDEALARFEEVLTRQPGHPEAVAGAARVKDLKSGKVTDPNAPPPGPGLLDTVLSWFGLKREGSS